MDNEQSSLALVQGSMDISTVYLGGAILKPRTPGEYVAYVISQLGSPPVMTLVALILLSMTLTLPGIWLWSGLYVTLGMFIPLGYVIWLLSQGKVTDLDLQLREQRTGPFRVALSGLVLALVLMVLGRAPYPLLLLTGASLVQAVAVYCITLRWKISVHTSTAAGMTILMLSVVGLSAAPLAVTVPIIAWSRVKLRRHTLGQTVAGVALGSAIFMIVLLLLPLLF